MKHKPKTKDKNQVSVSQLNKQIFFGHLFLSSFIWLNLTFPAAPPTSHLAHFAFGSVKHRGALFEKTAPWTPTKTFH